MKISRLNLLEETRYEKLQVCVYPDDAAAAKEVAKRIAELIIKKQSKAQMAVLGLATGNTPIKVYAELVRLHREEGLSFKNVVTFNLDEYYPMSPTSRQSYVIFMQKHLFSQVDINPHNVHIPDGTLSLQDIPAWCLAYENLINTHGGIDLQLLGIGRTGHIGFNEPGSAPNSGTRLITLNDLTRRDAARDFGGKANVPTKAITMGVGTIFNAKQIILMAWGETKAEIIKAAVEGDVTSVIPATYLQMAENVEFIIDREAASALTRFDRPWLVKDCEWDDKGIKKAVIWLAKTLKKPILKLTEEDYSVHGLAQLATEHGPVQRINIKVFNQLQHTISGWPGGKPNADDTQRPERSEPAKKNILLFSPHPDDDVISMGGTFIRLVDQGHNVHVAYQTSGNTAVWDDDVLRFMEFSIDYAKARNLDDHQLKADYDAMREFFNSKQPNDADAAEIRLAKALIRKGEATAGARFAGLADSNIHFMDLPFYDRGKKQVVVDYEDDIRQTMDLLRLIKPQQVYAAGDFADPHGTHKVCFNIIAEALKRLKLTDTWVQDCWLWLYRGAWHEYELYEIEMAVPLSPAEVERKRLAIFKHQSQKDRPVFPGDDNREFWVRAEHRTAETATAYNQLGFAEYEAIEAFVRWHY